MRYGSNRYVAAAVSGLVISTLLALGAIVARSVEATERAAVKVTDLRGSLP
jgi:hypothetical protein